MTVNGDSGRHRERDDEVARRLAAGESYHQIAAKIGMSLGAVQRLAKNPPVDLADAEWEQLSKLEQWRARRDPSHPLHCCPGAVAERARFAAWADETGNTRRSAHRAGASGESEAVCTR